MPQRPSLLVLPFLFLEFRQSSSGDFVLMYRNGFDGFTYGPLGTFLSELFPTNIRYSGTLAFNMAGIIEQLCAYDCDLWRLIIV
jgi:hypothetical protein